MINYLMDIENEMNAVQCENNVVLKIKLEQDNLLRLHVSEYVAKLKPSDVIILNYFDIYKNNYQTINCKIGKLVYEKELFDYRPVTYYDVCNVKDNKETKNENNIVGVEYDDAVIIKVNNTEYFVSREKILTIDYKDKIELNSMLDNNSILKIYFDKEKRIFVKQQPK